MEAHPHQAAIRQRQGLDHKAPAAQPRASIPQTPPSLLSVLGNETIGRLIAQRQLDPMVLLNGTRGLLGLQPRLRVSAAEDPQEQEADRVADAVMRMPEPREMLPIARTFDPSSLERGRRNAGEDEIEREADEDDVEREADEEEANRDADEKTAQSLADDDPVDRDAHDGDGQQSTAPALNGEADDVQREPYEDDVQRDTLDDDVQRGTSRSAHADDDDASPDKDLERGEDRPLAEHFSQVAEHHRPARRLRGRTGPRKDHRLGFVAAEHIAARIQAARGGGAPLDGRLRDFMEPRLGAELSDVRLHTDSEAASLSRTLRAHAFTVRSDVFFAAGRFDPDSTVGKRLLAHELTHVLQQSGRRPLAHSPTQVSNGLPRSLVAEPHRPRAAEHHHSRVAEGHRSRVAERHRPQVAERFRPQPAGPHHPLEDEPLTLLNRQPEGPSIQRSWLGDAWKKVKKGVKKAASAVGNAVADVGRRALDKIAGGLRAIPGYGLLTTVLGKDPISGKAAPGEATSVFQKFLALVPGGAKLSGMLSETGALSGAFAWLKGEWKKLGITWSYIKDLLGRLLRSFKLSDVTRPSQALQKVTNAFAPLFKKLKDFAVSVGKKVLEFIFEGAMKLAGPTGQKVLEVLKRTGRLFLSIVKDPIGFGKNLIQAVKQGVTGFMNNALGHLKNGLTGWLFGALAGAGLALPDKLDLKGVLSLGLQLLGITWQSLRARLVQAFGEERVKQLEAGVEVVKKLATGKLDALREALEERIDDVKDSVLDGIKEWAVAKIVKSAILKLVTMFNPAGAIIQAALSIYNTIRFFMERASQIAELANSVMESISEIVAGRVSAAAGFIEQSMAKAIPVILGFLARFVGLGNITGAIKKVITKIQAPIGKAMDKAAAFIKDKAQALWNMVTGKKEGEESPAEAETAPAAGTQGGAGAPASFADAEKRHQDNLDVLTRLIQQGQAQTDSRWGRIWMNTCQWLTSGKTHLHALTQTHDASSRAQANNKAGMYAYFGAAHPWPTFSTYNANNLNDITNVEMVKPTWTGYRRSGSPSKIVIIDPISRKVEDVQTTMIHEAQHDADGHTNDAFGRYASEFRAYWIARSFDQHTRRSGSAKNSLRANDNTVLAGFGNARQQHIFLHLYNSPSYAYVSNAWASNTTFKSQVLAMTYPKGTNIVNSVRIDDLSQKLTSSPFNLSQALASIGRLNWHDRAVIANPAVAPSWRQLIARIPSANDQKLLLEKLKL